MEKLKDPLGKLKIKNIFVNKNTGQISIVLPKKKMLKVPKFVEVSYW